MANSSTIITAPSLTDEEKAVQRFTQERKEIQERSRQRIKKQVR